MIDLLYVAYNRLAYTKASFSALLANTDWNQVATLYVHDDASTDGTRRWLRDQIEAFDGPTVVVFESHKRGSPVAIMNWYLDQESEQTAFVKMDSDFVVPPGWLGEVLLAAHLNPGVDAIGIAPWEGPPSDHGPREILRASHIGGIGLIHKRMFAQCRPVPRGRYGWTEHQHNHDFQVGWLKPDLRSFELDRLPFEPWMSLAQKYESKGWSRRWPCYSPESSHYWSWWLDLHD